MSIFVPSIFTPKLYRPAVFAGSGAAGAAAPFISDTFTDIDRELSTHAGETGATWTKHASSHATAAWAVSGNRATKSGGTYNKNLYYASGAPLSAEYDIDATIRFPALGNDVYDGIAFRASTITHTFYGVGYASYSGFRRLELLRFPNSDTRVVIATYSWTPTLNVDYLLRVEVRNASKRVYLNNVMVIESADNTITDAGRVGVFGYGDENGRLLIESLTATDA